MFSAGHEIILQFRLALQFNFRLQFISWKRQQYRCLGNVRKFLSFVCRTYWL